jgi:hypothetical protein
MRSVSGTAGLTGAADTVLVINKNTQGTTLYGRGRDLDEIDMAMQFNRETCRWKALGEASEIRRSDERSQILEVLKEEAGAEFSPAQISTITGMRSGNVRRLLPKMVESGEVLKGKRGKNKTPGNNDHKVN